MAISREKKQEIVGELVGLLEDSRLTVFATYIGLTVAQAQQLREIAKDNQTSIKVVKNRLVKVALSQVDNLKDIDTTPLKGQLLYAINTQDEVAAAQVLAEFGKKYPAIQLVGGIDAEGNLLDTAAVKHLADLPSKDQLRAQLVATVAAPLSGLSGVLSGNLRGLANVLKARAAANVTN